MRTVSAVCTVFPWNVRIHILVYIIQPFPKVHKMCKSEKNGCCCLQPSPWMSFNKAWLTKLSQIYGPPATHFSFMCAFAKLCQNLALFLCMRCLEFVNNLASFRQILMTLIDFFQLTGLALYVDLMHTYFWIIEYEFVMVQRMKWWVIDRGKNHVTITCNVLYSGWLQPLFSAKTFTSFKTQKCWPFICFSPRYLEKFLFLSRNSWTLHRISLYSPWFWSRGKSARFKVQAIWLSYF